MVRIKAFIKKKPLSVVFIALILALLGGYLIFFIASIPKQKYIDSIYYTYDPLDNLNLTLDITNNGNVHLQFDESLSSLFQAEIKFFGGCNANISDLPDFQQMTSGNEVIISYHSTHLYDEKDSRYFYTDLIMKIHPNTSLSLDLDSECYTRLYLWSEIDAPFRKIDVHSNSSIVISTGNFATLTCDNITLESSFGDIELWTFDTVYNQNFTWFVRTTCGYIKLYVGQYESFIGNYTVLFDIDTISGLIDAQIGISDEYYGWNMILNTINGKITGNYGFSGTSVNFFSEDYDLRDSKFHFDFNSISGDIKVGG